MSHGTSNEDRDLFSRLNALKKSNIELDQTKHPASAPYVSSLPVDLLPSRALLSDLTARFNSLKGGQSAFSITETLPQTGSPLDIPELQNESNDKTVEELLAELGPEVQWTIGQNDKDEVEELLKHAKGALEDSQTIQAQEIAKQDASEHPSKLSLPAVDISIFQPETESEDEDSPAESQKPVSFDHEADETLQRLLDEIKHDPTEEYESPASSALELPSTPVRDLEPKAETEEDSSLSARFASLSLPSVPTTLKSSTKSKSSTLPPPDDEIDTWCIICLSDATLRCLGCDGDLYCANCWMEGHRGEDAGYEERRHRAVQFVKGGRKVEKRKVRRTMVGA